MTVRGFLSLLFLVATTSCSLGIDSYDPTQVVIEEARLDCDGKLTLRCQVLLETMYWSPGILVRRGNQELHVEVVRCSIYRKCTADAPSSFVDARHSVELSGMSGVVRLQVRGKGAMRAVDVSTPTCPIGSS